MKSNVLTLSVFALCLLPFAFASGAEKSPAATNAIRATVNDYIQAYYTADAARMERSLHPQYLKHTISGTEGNLRMTEKTGLQMVEDIRSGHPVPEARRQEQITVLDVNGDIASAKLVTPGWTDYLTLAKWNGQWKIVSVVLREND
ncbi:MAG TPA: nuclear transport factor 2 family protein [Candidatus Angelobacter sp.]|nr:nuclear transport factor 2 family protein [Candidatus Angelobacter sp.]